MTHFNNVPTSENTHQTSNLNEITCSLNHEVKNINKHVHLASDALNEEVEILLAAIQELKQAVSSSQESGEKEQTERLRTVLDFLLGMHPNLHALNETLCMSQESANAVESHVTFLSNQRNDIFTINSQVGIT